MMAGRNSSDGGAASVQLVVLVIPIMVLVAFTVFVGRYSATRQEVASASRDAARAASVLQRPDMARSAGERAAQETLGNRSISCSGGPVVEVNVDNLHPGGYVEATVRCQVSLSDLAGFNIPGNRTVESASTAVVDTYRGGDQP
jgi:Flp pilus assembly protein TadG